MKAAIHYGPKDYRIEEIEDPSAGEDGLVVKVKAAGVCGGDLHAYKGLYLERPPGKMVYGHENAGEVAEVGSNVKDFKVGDRVFSEALGVCFECDACKRKDFGRCAGGIKVAGLFGLDGGFAEYLWLPAVFRDPATGVVSNVFKLPDTMTFEEGALVEPVNIGLGVAKSLKPEPGHIVLVIGAGMIGLSAVLGLKSLGVNKVISCDISARRLEAAGELGADVVINAEKEDVVERVMAETGGKGAHIVVEAAGVPKTFRQAIGSVRPGGRVSVVAYFEEPVEFSPHWLIGKHVTIVPGGGGSFRDAFDLIKTGAVKKEQVISHVFPLDKINDAHDIAIDTKESVKVMIAP